MRRAKIAYFGANVVEGREKRPEMPFGHFSMKEYIHVW